MEETMTDDGVITERMKRGKKQESKEAWSAIVVRKSGSLGQLVSWAVYD